MDNNEDIQQFNEEEQVEEENRFLQMMRELESARDQCILSGNLLKAETYQQKLEEVKEEAYLEERENILKRQQIEVYEREEAGR